jgi:hypothetical protein
MTRILVFAGVLIVIVAAVLVNLAILDVLSRDALTSTLGKTASVVAVTTGAIVVVLLLVRLLRGDSARPLNKPH